MLLSIKGITYFKVPIPKGIRINTRVVEDTCEKVGLRAVCPGPDAGCKMNSKRCLVTGLSSQCANPLYPLSILLCTGQTPYRCDETEGMFISMTNRLYGAACGAVKGSYCNFYAKYVSGAPKVLFAYCAK